jgi:rare lipoprotein A (peptidoglycan hydrolase)
MHLSKYEQRIEGNISWYGTGTKGNYTACWSEFPKGTRFKVTVAGKSVVVTCTDRGRFKPLGRVLDLSRQAFEQLAPLRRGIIRGAKIEVL